MELKVEISELKLQEFGYYVLQVSSENASNSGTLQINCFSSGIATNCGQVILMFEQSYPSVLMKFRLAEQGNSSVVLATGTSTILLENRHSKLFYNDSVVLQSVMMTTPSDFEELQKYFGIITFKALSKSTANYTQVPVLQIQASVNTHSSVSAANTPLLNVAHLIHNQQKQLLSSTMLSEVHSTVYVCFHAIEGISQKFLGTLACLGVASNPKNSVQTGNVLYTTKEQQSILNSIILSHNVDQNNLELYLADQHRGMLLASLHYPLKNFVPFNATHLKVPLEFGGGWGSVMFTTCIRPPLQHYSGYEGIELLMSNIQVKEDFSQHFIVVFGIIGDASFPSMLVPNKPPFVPVDSNDISNATNTGQITVICPQSSDIFPLYLFFPFIDGIKQDTLHLIFYCMSPGQTKPWWNSPKFVSLSLPIIHLNQGQPTRWHQSDVTNVGSGGDLLENFDFVVQCKTPFDQFLSKNFSMDQLPLVKQSKLPSPLAMNAVLPQPSNDNPKPANRTPPTTPKPMQKSVMENDVYVHLVSEVKEYRLAISRMGEDILGLRSENARLREEVDRLQQIIASSESTHVLETTELEACSKLELIHKLSELYQKYTTLSAANSTNKQEIQSLRNVCIQKNDLEKEYVKLQNAHTAQQKLMQKLQGKVDKYRRYSQTIQDREVVINKLETLLEKQVNKQQGSAEAQVFLSEENARLRAQLRQLQEDINDKVNVKQNDSKLIEQLEQLQKANPFVTSDSNLTKKLEARVKALQEQLRLNATEWGIQKTQMEIEITRLRAQVGALMGQVQPPNKTGRQFSQNTFGALPGGVTKPVSL